jgi:hypothetical protein
MYHYLVRGDYEVLRNEVQDFFDHTNWHVHSIPDPRDHDPERYAILAAITQYLVHGINRQIRISRGCRKVPPGPWKTAVYDATYSPRGNLPMLEKLEREPRWAGRVKMVENGLEICQSWEGAAWGQMPSMRFAAKGISSTEVVELFI